MCVHTHTHTHTMEDWICGRVWCSSTVQLLSTQGPNPYLESFITCISLTDSYFEGSESDSEGEVGGESEEAIKKRIAAEYQSEGLWSTTSSSVKDNEQGQGGGAEEDSDDDDPLDAFMAGIEVKSVYMCRDMFGNKSSYVFSAHRLR